MHIHIHICCEHTTTYNGSIYLSVRFFLTAVAIFRKPNAIPLCFFHCSDPKFLVVHTMDKSV